jgi:WXG100 family type VII secretion target
VFSLVAVTAEAVNAAAQAADDAATKIRTQVNTTVGSMQAQAASFTGIAGSAFRHVLGQFAEDMDKAVLQRLETLADNTRTAANQMFSQDQDGGTTITRAGTSPGGVHTALT